ncbi:beta-galactosidase [Methylocystis sp. JR02]|uniref:beta-galactosidase n=1 Tax=Methylocystis sp. JR02 TaxID=3046284 RepID=UPI0024BB0E62|nr:beta-galactosidase [Methylocystis sp. JR02]MDJ0449486.1 beta-galactosidase [Methylocystis sp. JR02]
MTEQKLGVCYYPEHWPTARWAEDARRMREIGLSVVRVGEFAWSRLEPSPGAYDFDWLRRAIETLHEAGLEVVLGTPTATPPKWLVDSMPEMLALDTQGRPRKFGSRRHYCFSHEGYARECDRIVTRLAQEFGAHPAVAAWQTDNEFGCHNTVESYSVAALAAFRDWCRGKYETIEALNEAWGNVFWSMELSSFEEIELPNLTVTEANPSHLLDFQRFSSDQIVAFNKRQADIIRRYSPGRSILHNFMGAFTAFDHFALSRDLDAAAWDSYPLGFLERSPNSEAFKSRYMRVGDPDFQAFHHDLYRGCGRGRWWVMEQQPGPVNWAPWNPAPAKGAVRLWAHEAFAAGAETVCYFRWRQAPFAQEQMHEALLLPNSEPNEAFHEAQDVARELAALSAHVGSRRAEVVVVFDYESDWAWKIQPQGQDFSYSELVMRFYRALRRAGVSIDIGPPTAETVADRKLILLPGLFTAGESLVEGLSNNAAVILAGPRAGSKTEHFNIPAALPPGALQSLIDLRVRRVESLRPGAVIPMSDGHPGHFERWREFLVLGDEAAIAMASRDGECALAQCGHRYYLGGWPDETLADAIVSRLLAEAGVETSRLPQDIRVRDNGGLRYVFNYGPETADISSLVGDAWLLLGETKLPPCGVAAFRKDSLTEK